MADKKISALTGAATPLAGTEVLPIVQSGATVKVAVSDLTAGRAVETGILTTTTLGTAGNTVLDTVYKTGSSGSVISRLQTASFSSSVFDLETNDGSGSNYRLGTTIYDSTISNSYAGANLWGNLNFATGGVIRATIVGGTGATAGNVGIGTTSPSAKLSVNGALSATGDITTSAGNLVIGTAGKGIDFSATSSGSGTMTSELLADYEEGTFTVTFTPSTSGTITLSGSYNTCSYTKVGRLVTVTGEILVSSAAAPVGTSVVIGGLPFAAGSGNSSSAGFAILDLGTLTLKPARVSATSSAADMFITASTIGINSNFMLGFSYIV